MPMKPYKHKTIRGKGARRKGSRAEIKVRNALRTIYPVELRNNVQRVPLSGAGAIKCDVMDTNDPNSAYEVKCQESLNLNDWWRQAKSRAGMRTPILVITQAYRPFYYIMKKFEWDAIRNYTEFELFDESVEMANRCLMDRLAELDERQVALMNIDDDECVIIPERYYLEVKEAEYQMRLTEQK